MSYKINGTTLTLQPSQGRWMPREAVGVNGNGHPIYPVERQYEMAWDIMDVSEYYQLQNFFDTLGVTGTITVDLPTYKTQTFGFTTYSGCVMMEPEFDIYFDENPAQARLLIARIRTA